MATGQLQRSSRKLNGKIVGKDVFARDMLNSDLDEADEVQDEYDELVRQRSDLAKRVDDSDDTDERKGLREQLRALSREIRVLDERTLSIYVETSGRERFAAEDIASTPVRMQTMLMAQAAKHVHGGADEVPTPGQAD